MNATRRNSCWEASPTPVSSWMFRRRWCHAMWWWILSPENLGNPWESKIKRQSNANQTPIKSLKYIEIRRTHWGTNLAGIIQKAILDPKLVNQSGPHFDVVSSHHQFFNLFAVLYLFHFIPLYIIIYGPSLHIITSNYTIMYFPWNTIPYKVWMAMSEMIMMGHRTVITDVPWAFFWSYNILFARYFLPLMMMACNPLQPILTHYNPL